MVTLILGLVGMVMFSIGFAVAAVRQIRRTGERGTGLVVGGLLASAAWTLIAAVLAVSGLVGGDDLRRSSGGGSGIQLYPRAGQCFDFTDGRTSAATRVVPCDQPHEAEMILIFTLPKGDWQGDEKVSQLGLAGCQTRLRDRLGTSAPVDNSEMQVLSPRRISWELGNRDVHCAIAAVEGGRLNAPIGKPPFSARAWDDLKPGDCFDTDPTGAASATVTFRSCTRPHVAQLTHRIALPDGPYPGDPAMAQQTETKCTERMDALFEKQPPPADVDYWHTGPTAQSWAQGDRIVLCYVTGRGEGTKLKRSAMPE